MAKTDQYMAEALSELERLSADERKRLEYEAREKAVRDYNSLMGSELRRGLEKGLEEGRKRGLEEGRKRGLEEGRKEGKKQGIEQGIERGRRELILRMMENNMSPEDIMRVAGVSEEEIRAAKKESR